jgi:hypothetical protein
MMALNKRDTDSLQEIVNLDGNCMNSIRCARCPFRAICLPEFLNPIPPTTQQRAKMALDVLAHHALVEEEADAKSIQMEFTWDKT